MCNKLLIYEKDFFHIYYNNGIYLKKNYSDTPHLIFKNAYRDFDAVLSSDGVIHIICQDNEGSIVYLNIKGEAIKSRTLLLSKNKHAYNKSFRIIASGQLIFAIYTIVKDLKTLLVLHCLNENQTPQIIDSITPAPSGFFVYTNSNSDINIFYTNEAFEMGYVKYIWSKKALSQFKPILKGGICPATADGESIVFLKDGRLCKKSLGENEDDEGSEKILCHLSCDTPPLCFGRYVFFKRGGGVYYIDTERQKPAERLFAPNMLPELFEIKKAFNKSEFIFGKEKDGKINFLSPVPVSIGDFFTKQPENDGDVLKLILQKLEKIENILKGV